MNKLSLNIIVLILSSIGFLFILIFNKEIIIKKYPSLLNFSTIINKNTLYNDLESGKITVFGSSELGQPYLKFIPQNYFNKDLKLPLRVNGHAGHQSFAIMSQLAAYSTDKVKDNARVVIFLSPGWFFRDYSKGTVISNFLEYMDTSTMYRLYFSSDVDNKFKMLISQYIIEHKDKIKNISYIYNYSIKYPKKKEVNYLGHFINRQLINYVTDKIESIKYITPKFNYIDLRKQVLSVARSSKTNNFGIYDEYYNQYIKPKILSNNFPYQINQVPMLENNQEYKDFLSLLEVLKDYKIKPLFIMQDLNPYAYKGKEKLSLTLTAIETKIKEYKYPYFNMWSKGINDYEIGTLTDVMHTGELGWVKINQKIIEHFMSDKKGDKK